MRYLVDINILNTSSLIAPVSGTVLIPKGMIKEGQLLFSKGVNGSMKALVMLGAVQIFPNDASLQYTLYETPYKLVGNVPNYINNAVITLKGFSNGATYDHRLLLTFDVELFDQPEIG